MDKPSSQYSVYYRVQAAEGNSRGKAMVYNFLSLALRILLQLNQLDQLNQQLTSLCRKATAVPVCVCIHMRS